jgi:hypothetical protein
MTTTNEQTALVPSWLNIDQLVGPETRAEAEKLLEEGEPIIRAAVLWVRQVHAFQNMVEVDCLHHASDQLRRFDSVYRIDFDGTLYDGMRSLVFGVAGLERCRNLALQLDDAMARFEKAEWGDDEEGPVFTRPDGTPFTALEQTTAEDRELIRRALRD